MASHATRIDARLGDLHERALRQRLAAEEAAEEARRELLSELEHQPDLSAFASGGGGGHPA